MPSAARLVDFSAEFADAVGGHASTEFQPDSVLRLCFSENYEQICGFRCVLVVFPHSPCLTTAEVRQRPPQ
ncbi:MAG: hypothetical protein RL328_214 [Acidobacteriota bacterium]